jgi:hypothetical protein
MGWKDLQYASEEGVFLELLKDCVVPVISHFQES